MKTIAFYSPHLAITGGPVSLYDYADHNEKILNNKSIIVYDHDFYPHTNIDVVKKFENRFSNIHTINSNDPNWHWTSSAIPPLDEVLCKEKCDGVFITKIGYNDGVFSKKHKTFIQCLSPQYDDPHGDVYSYASEWLAKEACNNRHPTVPFMVTLPKTNLNLRENLSIPEKSIVFGRHGGYGSFDINFVQEVIKNIVSVHKNIYFVFMNTPIFCDHPQIKYIPMSAKLIDKSIFINTCDAMIHAREHGEGFGLACGEFSISNKPIITYFGSKERFHIDLIGDRGFFYSNSTELHSIFVNFKKESEKNWNVYEKYNPTNVMEIFDKTYLRW